MRRSLLSTALIQALFLTFARAQGLTGNEVKGVCEMLPRCEAPDPAVKAFCSLASATLTRAAWEAVTFPDLRTVRATLACKPKTGPEAAVAEAVARGPSAAQRLFSGFNQSNLLWGTADFLVGRAEEELRAWAVDRFLRTVCDDKESRLGGQPIFPETCRVIQGTHLRGFVNGLGALRAAMRLDAQRLPALAFAEAAIRAPAAEPTQVDAALVGWQATVALSRILAGEGALAAIQAVAAEAPPRSVECRQPVAAALFHASALARTIGGEQKPADLKDRATRNRALLAMAVNRKSDPAISSHRPCPSTDHDGKSWLPGPGFDVEALDSAVADLLAALERARTAGEELRRIADSSKPDAKERLQSYGRLAAAGVAVFRAAATATLPAGAGNPQLQMLTAAEELAGDLATGSYSTMVVRLGGALTAVWAQRLWPEEFQRLAAFAADVAEAQTAEDASAAIARAAEPVGAYRRKRAATGGYVGVNGYFGGSGVAEWTSAGKSLGAALGFWAPVGLELGLASRGGWSHGLLLQAIDVGVLASWRVSNDDLSAAPQVSVKQVFSPGAFYVLGLPRMPLSISLGVAFSPKLRTVSGAAGAVERERDAYRAGVAVAVDIPIFY